MKIQNLFTQTPKELILSPVIGLSFNQNKEVEIIIAFLFIAIYFEFSLIKVRNSVYKFIGKYWIYLLTAMVVLITTLIVILWKTN